MITNGKCQYAKKNSCDIHTVGRRAFAAGGKSLFIQKTQSAGKAGKSASEIETAQMFAVHTVKFE